MTSQLAVMWFGREVLRPSAGQAPMAACALMNVLIVSRKEKTITITENENVAQIARPNLPKIGHSGSASRQRELSGSSK